MTVAPTLPASSNFKKHTHRNPVQRWLLQRFHDRVAELVGRCGPSTVFDAGCGEGFVASDLLRRFPNLHISGVDGSLEAVTYAAGSVEQANFAQADMYRLPVASGSVDLSICLEVVEHLKQPERAIDELGRIARDWVILSTPRQPFFAGMNAARGKNWSYWGDDPDHVQWWTGPAFVRFVQQVMPVEDVVYSTPWTILVCRPDRRRYRLA